MLKTIYVLCGGDRGTVGSYILSCRAWAIDFRMEYDLATMSIFMFMMDGKIKRRFYYVCVNKKEVCVMRREKKRVGLGFFSMSRYNDEGDKRLKRGVPIDTNVNKKEISDRHNKPPGRGFPPVGGFCRTLKSHPAAAAFASLLLNSEIKVVQLWTVCLHKRLNKPPVWGFPPRGGFSRSGWRPLGTSPLLTVFYIRLQFIIVFNIRPSSKIVFYIRLQFKKVFYIGLAIDSQLIQTLA